MKKPNKFKFLVFWGVLFALFPNVVQAADQDYESSFIFYEYDYNTYSNDSSWWLDDYQDEYVEEITDLTTLKEGNYIAVAPTLKLIGDASAISFTIYYSYDEEYFEPVATDPQAVLDNRSVSRGGIFPNNSWKDNGSNARNGYGVVTFDCNVTSYQELANTTAGPASFLFFKVKKDITSQSSVAFKFYTDDNPLDGSFVTMASTRDSLEVGIKTIDYVLEAPASSDKTLSSLRLFNDDYTFLDLSWPDGSTETTFNGTVPADANNINITLTAKDANATILSGTGNTLTTSLDLTTGTNKFEYTVTAENGESEVYTVNIKRLDNTASLTSLSLSNGITLSFSSNTKEYTINDVPYQTKNTTVSASANNTATIESGTGEWTFTSSGSTPNTRIIRVNAENCNSEYADVPGNTCTYSEYKINLYRTAPSTDATLSNITINSIPLDNFEANTINYILEAIKNNVTSLNIVATPSDHNASVSINGDSGFTVGDNTITIKVTAEDGLTTKTYTLKVRRQSNDTRLESLNVTSSPQGTLDPTFDAGTKTYTYTYDESVSTITVEGQAIDGASIKSGNDTYTVGVDTSATIVVAAEDGTESSYVINFERAKSNDSSLKSLSVKNGENEYLNNFDSETLEYNVTVPNDIASVDISAEANSENIKGITGTDINIPIGFESTTVKEIIVTAEDNTKTTYRVNITREKSNNANLSDLKVNDKTVTGFDKDTLEYTLEAVSSSVSSLNITYTKENEYANVEILNNSLVEGQDNTVTVKVTSQDGLTVKEYKLIVRRKSSDATLKAINVTSEPQGRLDKEFSPTTNDYIYYYDRNVTTINVSVEKSDSIALVTGEGDYTVGVDQQATILVTPEDGNVNTYTITFVQELESDSSLQSLIVKNGEEEIELDPIFTSDNYTYNLTVSNEVEKVMIEATASGNYVQEIEGIGEFLLEAGSNTAKVIVTAEDGTKSTYTLNIIRQMSNQVSLKDLTIDGETIKDFNSNKTIYNITVPYGTSKITIGAIPTDDTATINPDELGEKSINGNSATFNFTVRAQDGTEETYTINVTVELNSDTTISDLTVLDKTPTWNEEKNQYELEIDSSILEISPDDIEVTLPQGATITKEEQKDLVAGENTYQFTVRAENGVEQTYKVVINREASTDNTLKTLTSNVGILSPEFDGSKNNYTLTLPKETVSFNIEATTNFERARITSGTGEHIMPVVDNQILVNVISESGDANIYVINIEYEKSNDASLANLSVEGYNLTPDFISNTLEYSIEIGSNISELTLQAIANNSSAKIQYQLNDNELSDNPVISLPEELDEGTIKIIVTAEDNTTTQTYQISYHKTKSTNNNLSSITIDGYTLNEEFNKDTLSYTVTVPNNVTSLVIRGTLEDNLATLKIGTTSLIETNEYTLNNLIVGENIVKLEVTSESGITKTYQVTITKEDTPGLNKITSSIHTITNDYITSVKPDTSFDTFKTEFDNDSNELVLYEADGITKVTNKKIGTGMILKLERGGKVLDQKIIVIYGDTNGDGNVELNDAVKIVNHYLETSLLTGAYEIAADVNKNNNVGLDDAVKIVNHYLETDKLY